MNKEPKYIFTHHFLDRYVYRFQDRSLSHLLERLDKLKIPTQQQYNKIKKFTGKNYRRNYLIDKDLVVVVDENILVTCWRLR